MQIFVPHGWARSVLPVGLMLALTVAHAQPQANTPKPLRFDPASAEAPAEPLVYRSSFTGYRALRDDPVKAWKDSNDLTAKIGGWRVYAKEARQPDTPNAVPTSAPAKAHAGHHGGQQ